MTIVFIPKESILRLQEIVSRDLWGQYFSRARYYDPSTGRFLSEDPIGFAGGDYNLYRYVGNNPVRFMDPFGNFIGGPVVSWAIKRVVSTVISKSCNDGPIANEDKEVERINEEARRRYENESSKCGVMMSCEPDEQVPSSGTN